MFKRLYAFISVLLLTICNLFAESYGFTSNHNGFWSWVLGIFLCAVSIAIVLTIWVITSDEFLDSIPGNKQWLFFLPGIFAIISFWIYPTYFCSFLGLLIGFGVACFFLKHKNKFSIFCGLICTLSLIFSFIIISKITPQEWWIWKYFVITIIFIFTAQSLSFTFYSSRTFAIILLTLHFITITIMAINERSIHLKKLSVILYISLLLIQIVVLITGISSYRKYITKTEKKYKTLFGKTLKEINTLINKVKKIDKYDLKEMAKSLKRSLTAFDEHNETAAVDNLEEFFRRNSRFNDTKVKGPENKRNYKEFCQIADILAKKLEYKYIKPSDITKTNNNNDDDDYDDDEYESEEENDIDLLVSNDNGENKNLEDLLNELKSLTGLARVKDEINKIIGVMKINEQREKYGLKGSKVSLHLIFSGNPGTGKTTVARLLAKIYKEIGILSIGQCIETDYSGLVSEYISETPKKTKAMIKKAMGGILFIDEAYTLTPSNNSGTHSQEAIDTLLKYMEDKRDDFMVIAAGYPKEMENFVKSNPGLESRFTTVIHFDDYNEKELYNIFIKMATSEDKKFIIPEEYHEKLQKYFEQMYKNRKENFANAREVRNYLEQCEKRLAARLAEQNIEKLTKKELTTFTAEDLDLENL